MAIDLRVLDQFPDLAALSPDHRRLMAATLTEARFKTGAQICREGDPSDCCWFLVEGTVEVIKVLPDGRRVKLATLSPGTAFGQSGLIENQARTAEIKALENVYILALTQKSLRWSLGRGDAWAVAIQAIVAINLVRQLRSALARLSELAGAEDASVAVTGRSRDQIVQPRSISADFSGLRAKHAAEAAEAAESNQSSAGEEVAAELAEYAPSIPDAGSDRLNAQGLMNLLRDTEASLSGSGFCLDDVEIVSDEDMRRTAQARSTR